MNPTPHILQNPQSKFEFKNVKTSKRYFLVKASDVVLSPDTLKDIASICNEPDVYNSLFRKSLKGMPYPPEKALSFLEWAKSGWNEATHFVFLVLDEVDRVCGAADIKSNDLSRSEIGYWASKQHTGIMTPAVESLLKVAKQMNFKSLCAFVKKSNLRSITVLERNSFHKSPNEDLSKGEARLEFVRIL